MRIYQKVNERKDLELEDFVETIIISITIAAIYTWFLGETMNLLRDNWMPKLYSITLSWENLSMYLMIFGVLIIWGLADIIAFLWLFYYQYWKYAKQKPPQKFYDALEDVIILMPAVTVPWLSNQLYWLIIEFGRWDVHLPYFFFWLTLLLLSSVTKHYRFKKMQLSH